VIPTVFRTDYLGALRKLTRSFDPEVYVRAMSKAASFISRINFDTFEEAYAQLDKANAFSEDPEDMASALSFLTNS
jgi:hypothetical protein